MLARAIERVKEKSPDGVTLVPIHVLVIDDDPSLRQMMIAAPGDGLARLIGAECGVSCVLTARAETVR